MILSAISMMRNNVCDFLFASLNKKSLSKWDLLQKEKNCSRGANSFLVELTLIGKKGFENAEVLPINLN